jgi:competence protein ComEC
MALSALLLGLSLGLPFLGAPEARATFIDVGQGDSTLVQTARGSAILIDGGGTRDNRFDVGGRVLAPYLHDRGVRTIDLMVLSHPHPDHMNGLLAVLKDLTVREVWASGLDTALPGYAEFREMVNRRKVAFREVSAGDSAERGGARLEVLHPGRSFRQRKAKAYAEENDRSLVIKVTLAGRVLLFPGDIHANGERELLKTAPGLTCDVLKVPHHGSRTSSTAGLVETLRPRVAIITVADGNLYRHPSEEVVERYVDQGASVYRTDRHGAVTVRLSPKDVNVRPWSDLLLKRISTDRTADWWRIERENGKRLLIRTAGT